MKLTAKILSSLAIMVFIALPAASSAQALMNTDQVENTIATPDGDEKKAEKKACPADCKKDCCTKKSDCSKAEKKDCCKSKAEKSSEKPAKKEK